MFSFLSGFKKVMNSYLENTVNRLNFIDYDRRKKSDYLIQIVR